MMTTEKQPDPAKEETKVLIVDDHPIVRQGLAQLIGLQADLTVCGEAANVTEALKAIGTLDPDVAVIDLCLDRDFGGIELIKDVKARFPKLSVLVLSMYNEEVFAERVIKAGAKGYVMKEQAPEVILTAIRRVANGQIYLSDNMATKVLASLVRGLSETDRLPMDRLTDRELEIIELIGRGFGTSQIAEKLHLSRKTIETHRAHIKQKLQIETAGKLRQYAIQWVQGEFYNQIGENSKQ